VPLANASPLRHVRRSFNALRDSFEAHDSRAGGGGGGAGFGLACSSTDRDSLVPRMVQDGDEVQDGDKAWARQRHSIQNFGAEHERVEYRPELRRAISCQEEEAATDRGHGTGGEGGRETRPKGGKGTRPQTAPAQRGALVAPVGSAAAAAGRLRVAPEVGSPKTDRKKTTIRLTATGCFRSANRPASARPTSAGKGIPGLTRPSSAKTRDKDSRASNLEDAVALANRRKRGNEQKVFILSGPFKEVRDALIRRGWCENSTKDSHIFDLKWTLYDNEVGYAKLRREQMVNHFQGNGEITTKGLLCRNVRNSCWVADVDHEQLFPRCFHVFIYMYVYMYKIYNI